MSAPRSTLRNATLAVSLALTAPLLLFAAYFWRYAAFAILVVAVAIVLQHSSCESRRARSDTETPPPARLPHSRARAMRTFGAESMRRNTCLGLR